MAQRKLLFSVERISDDECGMYRIGEIDTLVSENVREYINDFGEFGYQELIKFAAHIIFEAQLHIKERRFRAGN